MTQAVPIECIQEALEKGRECFHLFVQHDLRFASARACCTDFSVLPAGCQITSQLGLVASTFHLREALDRIRSGEQASAGSVPI